MNYVAGMLCLVLAQAMVAGVAAADAAKPPAKDPAAAPAAPTKPAAKPPAAAPQDDPALPRVLILGDSISLGYTPPVTKFLAGRANVRRPAENCQHTAYGLAQLEKWLGKEKWDVIHFNWGIWDTHLLDAKTGALIRKEEGLDLATVRVRHTAEQYEANLTKLVERLKATGATLVWASTTPVTYRTGDRAKVISAYNEIAARVMKANGIAIDDLAAVVAATPAKFPQADGVHYTAPGCQNLAEQVGQAILDALAARARK